MSLLLELNRASVGYGMEPVLHEVDFSMQSGEFVGLLGPNGAGKTTLVRLVSGVLALRSGTARIQSADIHSFKSKDLAKLVATVPQQVDTSLGLSVRSVVRMARYPWLGFLSPFSAQDLDLVDQAMDLAGVRHLANRPLARLSGGEQQRVLLARALAQDTALVLLDEAASHLDPARRTAMFDLLARRNGQGLTVLAVVHDLNLAALYCHRLVFLKQGRVVAQGAVEDVFTRDVLESVYETTVRVLPHPVTGRPQALLVPAA